MHEGAGAQGFGSQFELLQIVEGEVGPGGDQVEALVADLDYAQHLVWSCRGSGRSSICELWRGEAPRLFSEAGLILSKMLACFTRVKLLNSSVFLVTTVWAATAVELEIGMAPAVAELKRTEKLQ